MVIEIFILGTEYLLTVDVNYSVQIPSVPYLQLHLVYSALVEINNFNLSLECIHGQGLIPVCVLCVRAC